MTDKQPTQEQIKEFWEWCGLNLDHAYEPCGVVGLQTCKKCGALKPAIFKSCRQPELDLNNLFKYAVPKVQRENEISIILPPGTRERAIVRIGHDAPADKPSLKFALFWAIYEVMHHEN